MKHDDGYEPKHKGRMLKLATPIAKAYVERERRKRRDVEPSPLTAHEALTGKGNLHIRQEENGQGVLIVNGSVVVHANPTALFYLKLLFANADDPTLVRKVTRQFKVSSAIARQDLADLRADLERLEKGEAPVRGTRVEPLSGPMIAPMRADIALTYRSGPKSVPQSPRELSVDDWVKALDGMWDFGIPHVCITGGEPTLREDLVDIVEHASAMGMMAGLLTNGERLGSHAFLGRLIDAGLSYVQVSIASHDAAVHEKVLGTPDHQRTVEGIKNCIRDGMPLLVNIFFTKESDYDIEETVEFLIKMGVRNITVNPLDKDEQSMPDWMVAKALEKARKAARRRARVFCFGPVPGKAPAMPQPGDAGHAGDLSMGELEWGAGLVSVHIHPDGAVTAGRAHIAILGNVLTRGWNMIWYHTVLKDVRARQAEGRRYKALEELGFNGYPLFPGLNVSSQG